MQRAHSTCKKLNEKLLKAEAKVNSAGPGFSLDPAAYTKDTDNRQETKLINYIDAANEYKAARKAYLDARASIEGSLDYLLYWEGRLIYHVYIYNAEFYPDDDLKDAAEIVGARNRYELIQKLDEAKEHLADLLRNKGVEIE
jgi:hypothetical protein